MVRSSLLPALTLALLLLVAPVTAQDPDGPGQSNGPAADPGSGQGPGGSGDANKPDTPPGQDGREETPPADEPAAEDPSSGSTNETSPDSGSSPEGAPQQARTGDNERTLACRVARIGVGLGVPPGNWFRFDPDGCITYTVQRLIENRGR